MRMAFVTCRFEWADMRKAAWWGDPVLQRMRPPKKEAEMSKHVWTFLLNPFDLVLGWHVKRRHKKQRQKEFSKPEMTQKGTMQHYQEQQAEAVLPEHANGKAHGNQDQDVI